MEKPPAPALREIYPHFTDDQLAEAEAFYDEYLALVLALFEDLKESGQLTEVLQALRCLASANQTSS